MTNSPTSESDLKKRIAAACVGLIFISETDSPVEPYFGKKPSRTKAVEVEFEKFFARLTAKKEWHSQADRNRTDGFKNLKAVLEAELQDLHVYRTGDVQVEIFVLGKDKEGKTGGVKMRAVET